MAAAAAAGATAGATAAAAVRQRSTGGKKEKEEKEGKDEREKTAANSHEAINTLTPSRRGGGSWWPVPPHPASDASERQKGSRIAPRAVPDVQVSEPSPMCRFHRFSVLRSASSHRFAARPGRRQMKLLAAILLLALLGRVVSRRLYA